MTVNFNQLTRLWVPSYLSISDLHMWTKRKEIGLRLRHMYRITDHKSLLSIENIVPFYNTMLKPIRVYEIQPRGTADEYNLEIIRYFQNNVWRAIVCYYPKPLPRFH